MPTGYTAGVADGTITDFATYALQCARAFGETIMLRDEPLSADIPEFEPSDYHEKALRSAMERLAEFACATDEQRREMHAKEQADRITRAEECIADRLATRERYEEMLKKAKAFTPPTLDHKSYAEFLISQLTESIIFDCDCTYYGQQQTEIPFDEWEKNKIESLDRDVRYHDREHKAEIERTEGRNRWVRQLREAIAAVEPETATND